MSTFDGFVSEFPQIRIDQFRTLPGKPAPLACFLSHVHSDHLQGLEALKAPFVYCSPATREILLRLEKFPHRMNFSKGILECRKQTYRHLRALLKPIPMQTPTAIELSPGKSICVTLFDANHCAGAVMFLIEGQGKAILYTGDIRSEAWWVNNLVRHPKLITYTLGSRRLDKVYLDTTFGDPREKHVDFPPKAEGLRELLEKVEAYPKDTVFYLNAWTFGYEDVWLALSQVLDSPVHLDRYRYDVYTSVKKNNGTGLECLEASVFCGFKLGNNEQAGILTSDTNVRLHSCERGTGCDVLSPDNAKRLVTITPIISRYKGRELRELGAGGGHGDLNQTHELDLSDMLAVKALFELCAAKIEDQNVLRKIVHMLMASAKATGRGLQLDPEHGDPDNSKLDLDAIPLEELPDMLAEMSKHQKSVKDEESIETVKAPAAVEKGPRSKLPSSITFPYSRHSSSNELRLLLAALKPRDIWPCTYPPPEYWDESLSMENMFGDLCTRTQDQPMEFDIQMRAVATEAQAMRKRKRAAVETQRREAQTDTEDDSANDYEDVTEGPERTEDVQKDTALSSPSKRLQGTVSARPATPVVHTKSPKQVPKASKSAQIRSLDNRINEAIAEDSSSSDMERVFDTAPARMPVSSGITSAHPHQVQSHRPDSAYGNPKLTLVPPHSNSPLAAHISASSGTAPLSAEEHYAIRQRAFDAACNGTWINQIELESVTGTPSSARSRRGRMP